MSKVSNCYSLEVPNRQAPVTPSLERPRDGQRVVVAVREATRKRAISTGVTARQVSYSELFNEKNERRRLRNLGCKQPRL